jgi:hypothetical protein
MLANATVKTAASIIPTIFLDISWPDTLYYI